MARYEFHMDLAVGCEPHKSIDGMWQYGYAGFILNKDGTPRSINPNNGKACDWTAKRRSTVIRYAHQITAGGIEECFIVLRDEGVYHCYQTRKPTEEHRFSPLEVHLMRTALEHTKHNMFACSTRSTRERIESLIDKLSRVEEMNAKLTK